MKPLVAHLSSAPKGANRRGAVRRTLKLHVDPAGEPTGTKVLIHNISEGGMLIETAARLSVGETLDLDLPHAGLTEARIVRSDGRYFGCRFVSGISKGSVSAALLRSPADAQPPAEAAAPKAVPRAIEERLLSAMSTVERIAVLAGLALLSIVVLLFLYAVLELPISS
ncbi:MAG TPA: PilZ domain-containing protein [Sphingomicrobium sp.]|nr:PilZ domain-containing protein [Sphingomicrobium sp.]